MTVRVHLPVLLVARAYACIALAAGPAAPAGRNHGATAAALWWWRRRQAVAAPARPPRRPPALAPRTARVVDSRAARTDLGGLP